MGSGERLNGIQEVSGSIPLISTKKVPRSSDFGTFSFYIPPEMFLAPPCGFAGGKPLTTSKKQGAASQTGRHRNVPVAVPGFGRADGDRAFDLNHCLPDVDYRTVFCDVLRFQSQRLLASHARTEHQTDADAHAVVGEQPYLVGGEGLLTASSVHGAGFVSVAHRVLHDEVVGLCLVEDLIEHSPALRQSGLRCAVGLQSPEKDLNVVGLDFAQFAIAKIRFEDFERVAVALLCGGTDIVPVVLEPEVSPGREGVVVLRVDSGRPLHFKFFDFGADFLLCSAIKINDVGTAIVQVSVHNTEIPAAIRSAAKGTFAI